MTIGLLRGWDRAPGDRRADLRALRFFLDDGTAAAIATGAKAQYQTAPVDLTIVAWRLMVNTSATISIDVWADRFAAFPPTVTDTIAGADKPRITAGVAAESERLTGWRTDLLAGDVVELNVDANDNAIRAVLELFWVPATV